MNHFKNLPIEIIRKIYEFDSTYKEIYSNEIIDSRLIQHEVNRRRIKTVPENNKKCLHKFLYSISNMYNFENKYDEITVHVDNIRYDIYLNNELIYNILIVDENQLAKGQKFNYCFKEYGYYLIGIDPDTYHGENNELYE